ncbi:hypothetical protein K523DRAFT_349079 [Schizophyllum commune Tattone D]|nr:hypothetical protein K523DRAFT_349079 [Schizophyllum commune Tattone D]
MSPTWFAALALPSLRTASRPLGRSAVSETQDIITQVCVTLALYGVQATLFAIAVPVLARKRGNAWKLLSAVTLAFIASSIGIATQMLAFVTQCPLNDTLPDRSENFGLSPRCPTRPMRFWCGELGYCGTTGLLAFCLILSSVGVIYETTSLPSRIWSNDLRSTLIINLPLLFTNVVATALVGLRVWFYRREVAAYISPMSTGTHIGGVLMLLFEAGAVYCVISVINLAIDISASSGSSSTPIVFTNAMFLIAGINPTLIVVAAICLSERTKASIWRSNGVVTLLGAWGAHVIRDPNRRRPTTLLSTSMADLRRSPSLESVSSVQSLASMQSAESVSSLVSTESPNERGAKTSDHENLNDIDMGRTITSIPILPPSASENGQGVDEPSSKIGDWANTCHDGLEPSSATCPSSGPAVKPALLNTKKHNRFYMDPRTIQLVLDDGTLYRVFRQLFEEHSSAFTTQYLADCSEDNPIKLPGVSFVDLDRFLSLMYPSELATCELSTADEWISVLRLAHKWSFAALRTRAIREVKAIGTAVDRIASAREFSDLDKLQEWLLPAFTETCTASDWLRTTTVDDAERLGAGTLLHIARIREDARQTTKKSSICAIERAIVAAGLAPAPPIETCAEPLALPADVTPTKPLASAPLGIPSSLCIVSKPTTTLDAQGSGSASPPITPADTSSVNLAAPIPLVVPVMTVKQAPTRPQKTGGSDTVAAAPRPASPAVVDQAESAKPASPVAPRPVASSNESPVAHAFPCYEEVLVLILAANRSARYITRSFCIDSATGNSPTDTPGTYGEGSRKASGKQSEQHGCFEAVESVVGRTSDRSSIQTAGFCNIVQLQPSRSSFQHGFRLCPSVKRKILFQRNLPHSQWRLPNL